MRTRRGPSRGMYKYTVSPRAAGAPRVTQEFLARDAALPDLDKIIMGTRAFQERLKQRPITVNADL